MTFQGEIATEFVTEEMTTNYTGTITEIVVDLDDATTYLEGPSRFYIFASFRIVIAIIGTIGNVLTLIIIKNLKFRSNGHILMIYLAASDIAMCLVSPVVLYELAGDSIIDVTSYWKELCIAKDYLDFSTTVACITSYTLLSIDRQVWFILNIVFIS